MKTIEAISEYFANENWGDCNDASLERQEIACRQSIEFAQRWIDVDDELPDCNIKGEDGVMLSETVLIKVKNNNDMPVVAIYIKVDDDEFFETLGVTVQQKRITHWRPIELK